MKFECGQHPHPHITRTRTVFVNTRNYNIESILGGDQHEDKCICPLTEDLLSEICDLIDQRNANPLVHDKFQRNILHYLAKFDISFSAAKTEKTTPSLKKKEVSERSKMQLKFFKMFLQYGCDPWLIDCDGDLPLAVALKVHMSSNQGCLGVRTALKTQKSPHPHS